MVIAIAQQYSKTLKNGLIRFALLGLALWVTLIAVRVYEYLYFNTSNELPQNYAGLISHSFVYDLLLLVNVCFYLLLPFLVLYFIKERWAAIFLKVASFLIITASVALIHYFAAALIPLDDVLFRYRWSDILQTVTASGELTFLSAVPFIFFTGLYLFLARPFTKINIASSVVALMMAGTLISAVFVSALPKAGNYKTDIEYYLVNNKLSYLCAKTYNKIIKRSRTFLHTPAPLGAPQKNYTDKNYPLIHTDNNSDVLGGYFNTSGRSPDFVFIIVEGLSRAFSGQGAHKGSFTPFLDSLAAHSLYWENFLSATGRTFGVLPTLFASLPYAEDGFASMDEKMPSHTSLIKILDENGYITSFYYGGNPEFDNMKAFLERQQTDYINTPFSTGYKKMQPNKKGFTWGYADKDLFKRALELTDKKDTPRLDIYLTLTTHSPFLPPRKGYYARKFRQRMAALGFSQEKKKEYRKSKKIYASIMYADDALRYFFNEYRKRDEFTNTIFIITGDHNMPEISQETRIDRYHVPFLIYSPLLKQAETFSSVSTHHDVTPTLLSFLDNNYAINVPSQVHWLGQVIDTVKAFRNVKSVAFMRNKGDLSDYLDSNYFLSDGRLYRLYDRLYIEPSEDETKLHEMQTRLDHFKGVNDFTCFRNRIWRK